MNSDFERNVLKYYDLLVEFEGQAPKSVARPLAGRNETFAQWKKRVLGDAAEDIRIFRPVNVPGATRMATLAEEGKRLKSVVRDAKVKTKVQVEGRLASTVEDRELALQEAKRTAKRKIKKVQDLAQDRVEQVRTEVLRRAETVPAEELEEILQTTDLDAATREFLQRVVEESRNEEVPLRYVLEKLVRFRGQAVVRAREN